MTSIGQILITCIIFFALWHVVSTILISIELNRRNVSVHPLLIGLMTMVNLGRYRDMTVAETGKVGFLYYSYIVSINISLVFAIVLIAASILI